MRAPSGSSVGGAAFYSGTVALDDGSPLPCWCRRSARVFTITDKRSRSRTRTRNPLACQHGASTGPVLDASQSGRRSSSGVLGTAAPWVLTSSSGAGAGAPVGGSAALGPVMSCEVRAVLAGYHSDSISLANRHVSDDRTWALIVLHRTGSSKGGKVGAGTLKRRGTVDAYTKALKSLHAGDARAAKKALERSVSLYPAYAEAWMELGFMASREHDWTESVRCLDQGLRLNPAGFPQAWYADAMAHYYLGEFDPAERSAREALRLDSGRRNRGRDTCWE